MSGDYRDFEDWPTLLLGPMVRRVTQTEASVFIATKTECEARLIIVAGSRDHQLGAQEIEGASGLYLPLSRLGEHLWVGLIQANVPTALAGSLFSYDIELKYPNGTTERLYELGELGIDSEARPAGLQHDVIRDDVPLGYQDGQLPTFMTPPASAGELHLIHGSCRKPHGGSGHDPDALAIADQVIAYSLELVGQETSNPAYAEGQSVLIPPDSNLQRPHQLILTGDQIYADDVAAGLLTAVSGAGEELLGWHEPVPGIIDGLTDFLIAPGWRTRFLDIAGLKDLPAGGGTDYSANHLLRFGEWVAMYLFAWSDALWCRTQFDGSLRLDLADAPGRLPVSEASDLIEHIESLPGITQVIPPSYEKLFSKVTELDAFSDDVADTWHTTRESALVYGSTVRHVRRLLANVAVYTMFDDHEVSDDWFLNLDVTSLTFGSEATFWTEDVGPRILRNALSAYAIFQHWGNAPEDFGEGSHGEELLTLWEPGIPGMGGGVTAPTLAGEITLDTGAPAGDDTRAADEILGIGIVPSVAPPAGTSRSNFDRMRWDHAHTFTSHQLIALDTRTWRAFPDDTRFEWPTNINPAEQSQLEAATIAHLDGVIADWVDAAAAVQSVPMSNVVSLIEAAARISAGTWTLADFDALALSARELLIELWSPEARAIGMWEIDQYEARIDLGQAVFAVDPRVAEAGSVLRRLAKIPTDESSRPLSRLFLTLGEYILASGSGSAKMHTRALRDVVVALGTDLVLLFTQHLSWRDTIGRTVTTAAPLIESALDAIVPDGLSEWFFQDGTKQLGAALISKEALKFQLTDNLLDASDTKPTIIVSPAPIFGNDLVEAAQRAQLLKSSIWDGDPGAEVADYEAWNVNMPAMNDLIAAAGALDRCVVLSGDVHYANSSVNDVALQYVEVDDGTGDYDDVGIATRYIQLTSSSCKNSTWMTTGVANADDFLWGDDGSFQMWQMALNKMLGRTSTGPILSFTGSASAAGDEGPTPPPDPTLLGWLEELAAEFVDEYTEPEKIQEFIAGFVEGFPKSPEAVVDWVLTAPFNSAKAWTAEVIYMNYRKIADLIELLYDPREKLFGDRIYLREVLRQQVIDLYWEYGIDPAYGHQVDRTMIQDLRHKGGPRMGLYLGQRRYEGKYAPHSHIYLFADEEAIQTVGKNNIGLVSFPSENGEIIGVDHELLWYPIAATDPAIEPGAVLDPGIPRLDWAGTLHQCAWSQPWHSRQVRPVPTSGGTV